MLKIPFPTWIANAAAGLTGIYGDVTRQADVADCSRQTIYDHTRKVQAAVEDAYDGGPTRNGIRISVRRMPNSGTGSLRPLSSHRRSNASSPSPPRQWD
jgi:hypothetical protein